jgi:fumarate reductase subunit C
LILAWFILLFFRDIVFAAFAHAYRAKIPAFMNFPVVVVANQITIYIATFPTQAAAADFRHAFGFIMIIRTGHQLPAVAFRTGLQNFL